MSVKSEIGRVSTVIADRLIENCGRCPRGVEQAVEKMVREAQKDARKTYRRVDPRRAIRTRRNLGTINY